MDIINEPLDGEIQYDSKESPMTDYFRGKTVLLTGGLGFLGQLYVEKLLRADVKVIYLMARPKKGKSSEERLKETFQGAHFWKLKKHDPNYLNRIRVIEGDLLKLNLAISETDLQDIYDNVEIILHAAADVRFDEKLVKLLMVNLRGTRELLDIGEKTKKLQVFSYISTGFSHCPRKIVNEEFYESPVDPNIMIELAEKYENTQNDEIEIMTERIITPWPNTYTYTKSLSEGLVRQYGHKFPICLIRPTIVISTHEDPVQAWCNNIYGLNGVLVASGMGVLRLMPLNGKCIGDIVCADFVINSTLAAIWVTHLDRQVVKMNTDPVIYHVSTYEDRPTTWGDISNQMRDTCLDSAPQRCLWKVCANSTTCPFLWKYLSIFYHVIPGMIFDLVLKIKGKNKRLMPVYRKVHRFMEALAYFMLHEWQISNTNMKSVLSRMSQYDQDFYPSDVKRFNWQAFTRPYNHGLRKYMSFESLTVSEASKRRYFYLGIAHNFVLAIYYGSHCFVFGYIAMKLGLFAYIERSISDTLEFIWNPQ